jgi:D-alanyl-D-alanine carboxypeptidase
VAAAGGAGSAAGAGYALASVSSVPAPKPVASAPVQGPVMVTQQPRVPAGSTEPLKPIAVKTIKVKLSGVQTAALAPSAVMIPVGDETAATASVPTRSIAPPAQPSQHPQPAAPAALPRAQNAEPSKANAWPPAAPIVVAAAEPVAVAAAPAPPPPAVKAEPAVTPARKTQTHSGWIIQIGAFETEGEAKQRLDAAQSMAKGLLGRADAFTETVTKGEKTLYRARFAGLERSQAEATCKQLKHSDIACMTVKN